MHFEYPQVPRVVPSTSQPSGVFYLRSVVTFFLSTIAFMFLLLANLSGAPAPFVRNLFFSKIEDQYSQYFWTMYNFCTYDGNELTGKGTCSITKAAYPYEPYRWTSDISNESSYKHGSQAAYAFILMALLFTFLGNLFSLAAFFKRSTQLFSIYKYITALAFVVIFIGAVINTALHRSGLSKIVDGGNYSGRMGKTLYAFIWLSVILQLASFLIATFWRVPEPAPQVDIPLEETGYEKNPFDSSRSHL